jgi:hypothetical protein
MRKLTKFFMAVVLLGAYACTTDTTKDLGANLGQGATEITISIEESRTQLGSEADGLYPLYWSEGDQISVNGLSSNELTAEEAGKASAKFSVQGLTAETYYIAYPAAGEGQVIFAKDQVHTSNTTFGSGVSTMFGKCNAGEYVTMQHLTGVLKIGVTGSATLTHAQISTVDRAPIAGVFDFDFDNEFITATEQSEVAINYSFGEGVTLSSDPTYLHVAVPAGEYNEQNDVTLYPIGLLATDYVNVKRTMFTIFFPQDGHAPAITPVPSGAFFKSTEALPNFPIKSCGILPFASTGTETSFFMASSFPLRIASGTSIALPIPAPTCPLPSPTPTSAENLI